MGRVEGKVAFITRAGRGQGRSHAVRLAQEGADIIAADLAEDIPLIENAQPTRADLDETVRQVEALDRRIVARKVDVRDRHPMKQVIDDGVAQLGKLDIAVANAGVCTIQDWSAVTPEVWDLRSAPRVCRSSFRTSPRSTGWSA